MKKPKAKVLIVDDEFLIQELLTILIENMGLKVCGRAATADHAVELALRHRPDIVLMDMRLQGEKDGVDAALAIHEVMDTKTIFITGSKEPKTVARIHLDHPDAVLFKPISDSQLHFAVEQALTG
jgi:DNA-binding NarL/FixJ family response regulator